MPETDDDTEDCITSTQWTNDHKDVALHTPLLYNVDLSDKDEAQETFVGYRTKCIKRCIEKGPNMWDQALEFSSRSSGASATVKVFAAKYKVKESYMEVEKGLGRKCNLSRSKIPQQDLRFRMKKNVLAYLPDIESFPDDQPIIRWWYEKDLFFLKTDRQAMLMTQAK